MKKIAFLGASQSQIPLIEYAKKNGHYCITIDNLHNNPGHKLADEYVNVSTLDIEGVFDHLKNKNIDAIISYASDIATPTAAIISERLNLKSNSFSSIKCLTDKELFRRILKEMRLNSPNNWIYQPDISFQFPDSKHSHFIIKPTDSAGTKGVTLVQNNKDQIEIGIDYAVSFSASKKIIIEEVIDNLNGDVHGDGFVIDGQLKFIYLGDHLYDTKINNINPTGTTWPSQLANEKLQKVKDCVNQIIQHVGFQNGSINIEARYNSFDELYIMEIGPRNGGYFVPLAIKYSSGVDLVEATLNQLTDLEVKIPRDIRNSPVAYYAIHSRENGIIKNIIISDWLNDRINQREDIRKIGDEVSQFINSSQVISVILIQFKDFEEMNNFVTNLDEHIQVIIHDI